MGKLNPNVVPDFGTGELRGRRGEARISIEPRGGHSFTLDYDFCNEITLTDAFVDPATRSPRNI